jgi:hypothetical protein
MRITAGVAILGGIPCGDRDRQPLVGPIAMPLHDSSGFLAVLLHVGGGAGTGLEDLGRHSPHAFGRRQHDPADPALALAQNVDEGLAIQC